MRRREADMADAHPILVAAMAGFVCAVFFSSLPGPINLTILNEGAQRGFKWAFFIGLGAAVMDIIYCSISFTGISQFIDHGLAQTIMRVMGFVFLLFIGFKFLLAKPQPDSSPINLAIEKLEERIEQKMHPHSAFAIGFVRVAANLGVLVAWVVLSATLLSTNSIPAKAACVSGVFTGAILWFLFWSFIASRGHGKFSAKTLLRLQQVSGLCLILTAIYEGVRIALHLAKQNF